MIFRFGVKFLHSQHYSIWRELKSLPFAFLHFLMKPTWFLLEILAFNIAYWYVLNNICLDLQLRSGYSIVFYVLMKGVHRCYFKYVDVMITKKWPCLSCRYHNYEGRCQNIPQKHSSILKSLLKCLPIGKTHKIEYLFEKKMSYYFGMVFVFLCWGSMWLSIICSTYHAMLM